LRTVLEREVRGWRAARASSPRTGATTSPITPISGDCANEIIGTTQGLHHLGGYADADVVIDMFDTGAPVSVAARTGVPGA